MTTLSHFRNLIIGDLEKAQNDIKERMTKSQMGLSHEAYSRALGEFWGLKIAIGRIETLLKQTDN